LGCVLFAPSPPLLGCIVWRGAQPQIACELRDVEVRLLMKG